MWSSDTPFPFHRVEMTAPEVLPPPTLTGPEVNANPGLLPRASSHLHPLLFLDSKVCVFAPISKNSDSFGRPSSHTGVFSFLLLLVQSYFSKSQVRLVPKMLVE